MRCFICKKFIRGFSKYELCSGCQSRSITTMIRDGIVDIDKLKEMFGSQSTSSTSTAQQNTNKNKTDIKE